MVNRRPRPGIQPETYVAPPIMGETKKKADRLDKTPQPTKFQAWQNLSCAWCDTRAAGNALHIYDGQWFASCGEHGRKFERFGAAPNIRPKVRPHSECWNQEWPTFGLLGDVRRCEHGVVQVLTETRSRTIAGPGTHWWRDLRKWLDRKQYRAAVAALRAPEEGGDDE